MTIESTLVAAWNRLTQTWKTSTDKRELWATAHKLSELSRELAARNIY